MNNYTFKDNAGTLYKRITKAQAKRAFDNGLTIILCPCNLKPFGAFDSSVSISQKDATNDFKRIENEFTYYNCINNETGYYSAFYVAIN